MPSNTALWKPRAEGGGGNSVFLTPNALNGLINQVTMLDSKGNVIETGNFTTNQKNGERGHFYFQNTGDKYSGNKLQITLDDGTNYDFDLGSGERFTSDYGNGAFGETKIDSSHESSLGTGGTSGGGVTTTPGGNQVANPSFVDYDQVPTPNIDFDQQLQRAREAGQLNRQQYTENLTDPAFRDAALDLVGTDIEGIIRGITELTPEVRALGDLDTQTNIERAGAIDEFNLSRIPAFNAANREAATEATQSAIEQRRRVVESTGLGFEDRISSVLDRMESMAEGRLPGGLDESLTESLQNRGAELAAASGFSPFSGAGIRASDRLMVGEKVAMAREENRAIPGVLTAAQQFLQPQEERAPTLFAQPTGVPLNPSTIEQRTPVQSSVSAGAARQNMANQATNLQVIPATTVLSTGISTEQFNQNSAFNRELAVLDRQQQQLTAQDTATQYGINVDRADQIRQEQMDAYREVQAARDRQNEMRGQGQVAGVGQAGAATAGLGRGGATTAPAGAPTGTTQTPAQAGAAGGTGGATGVAAPTTGGAVPGQPAPTAGSGGLSTQQLVARPRDGRIRTGNAIADTLLNNAGGVWDAVENNWGSAIDTVSGIGDALFGDGDGVLSVGSVDINQETFDNFINDVTDFFGGEEKTIDGKRVVDSVTDSDGNAGFKLEDGSVVSEQEASSKGAGGLINEFKQLVKPLNDAGLDYSMVTDMAGLVQNWSDMDASSRIQSAGDMAVDYLSGQGIFSAEEARDLRSGMGAISTVLNPNATEADKARAISGAVTDAMTTSFTGNVDEPTTIGGSPVIGTDGDNFLVETPEGVTSVPKSDLVNRSNALSALQAFSVITSDADTDRKVTALTGIGIDAAEANGLIDQVAGGNMYAALSLFNTAQNWGDMNMFQRAASVMQTSGAVLQSQMGASGLSLAENSVGSGALSFLPNSAALAGAGSMITGAAGIYAGIDQAADVIDAVNDMPRSQATEAGAIGLAGAGAAIGGGVAGVIAGLTTAGAAAASGAAAGAGIGTAALPVVGTIIGAAVGAVAGIAVGTTGSAKNTGQHMRDGWRGGLHSAGIADKDNRVTLADGSTYDIGLDGGHKLQNKGTNINGEDTRHTFDIDYSNPLASESIVDGHLFAIATGLDPTSNDGHGLFDRATAQGINAATSNANTREDVQNNFKAMMKDMDPRQIAMRVETMRASENISEHEYGVYLNSINEMYGTKLQPTERQKATDSLVQRIESIPPKERHPTDQQLLETLTDPAKLTKKRDSRAKRMYDDFKVYVPKDSRGNLRGQMDAINKTSYIDSLGSMLQYLPDTEEGNSVRQQIFGSFPELRGGQ